jgi:hypothetical protein
VSVIYFFNKTGYLNEEVNCTEPSPSVRVHWLFVSRLLGECRLGLCGMWTQGLMILASFANRYFHFFEECVNMQNELQLCKGARLF